MKDKRLLIIFLTVFIDLVGFGIIIPLNPYLAKSFGASPFEVGLLMSVYSLAQFVFSPIWGQLSDKYGRRPIILVSLVGAGLSHIGFAFGTSLPALILARTLAGMFGGNISTAMAYIADITPEKDRSKGMGLIGAAFGLGFVCGPFLGGVFGSLGVKLGALPPLGESFPALIAGAICIVNALFALKFLPESRDKAVIQAKTGRFKKIAAAISTPVLGALMLLTFLNTFAMAHVEASLFLRMQEDFLWTLIQASFGFAYCGLIMVFTQGYLIRKFMPKLGERKLLLVGFIVSAVAYGLLSFNDSLTLIAIGVTFLSVGNGLVNPSVNGAISLLSGKDVQGNNLGVSQSLASLARILGPPAGGLLYVSGHGLPFAAAGVLCAIGLLIALKLGSKIPERGKQA
jgi:MFS transporter, DHA1 family, tetracycline resistance protein